MAGVNWTIESNPPGHSWNSITYGNSLYVAVAIDGTTSDAMTSPDGMTWTIQTTPVVSGGFSSVCFGNDLFVAVSEAGTTSDIMTSPDGTNWTSQLTPTGGVIWSAVCFGNDLYVAVAAAAGNVMTSPDAVNWNVPEVLFSDHVWTGVCYGNGTYVAVATNPTGHDAMSSLDGSTWVLQSTPTSPLTPHWYSVTFGMNMFVATAYDGTGNDIMTSPDGATWTLRSNPPLGDLYSICFGAGTFVAVSDDKTGQDVLTSQDGITWTLQTEATPLNTWIGVCFGNNLFVAVAYGETGQDVMISESSPEEPPCFIKNTPIQTYAGIKMIQDITNEDYINGKRVHCVSKSLLPLSSKELILIKKNAISFDVPCEDTICTRLHKLMINKIWMNAGMLVNNKSILSIDTPKNTWVYHVLLADDQWGIMSVNNLFAETLYPFNPVAQHLYKYGSKESKNNLLENGASVVN